MSRRKGPIGLYFQYLPTYVEIQKNPRAQAGMKNDPGVKWMEHGHIVVILVIAVLYALSRAMCN